MHDYNYLDVSGLALVPALGDGDISEFMERLYKVFPWPEDPSTWARRVEEGSRLFESLLGHEWLSSLTSRGRVRILDLMGGTGVGGGALALALGRRGVKAEVVVVDVRRSALELAARLLREKLGVEAGVIEAPAEEVAERAPCPFDVILVYGLSAPHLDPYQFVRVASGMAACLDKNGVAVLEEDDRVYAILYRAGYRGVHVEEAGEDRLVVSYHAGYDLRRGMFRRLIVNHYTGERVEAPMRFWDIAGLAGILWAFFEDVDFKPTGVARGFLLARGPRGIDPGQYKAAPRIVGSPGGRREAVKA
jgi:SAM-dependent methyltransferase